MLQSVLLTNTYIFLTSKVSIDPTLTDKIKHLVMVAVMESQRQLQPKKEKVV